MFISNFRRGILYSLSSRAFMKTSADLLKLLCPVASIGAGVIVLNHEQLPGWGWQVLALCVAAVVSFVVGVFMQTHAGEPQR